MEHITMSTMAHDAAIMAAAFGTTHVLYNTFKSYMGRNLSNWGSIKPGVQNRMACELALLPSRFVMGICCLPIVLRSFQPESTWTPEDTSRAIIASATMAGCYLYDLMIERNDILSLIHHWIGPCILVWMRLSYATYTEQDATMQRLLVSFIYFGAAMGGTLTTTILILLKVLRPHIAAKTLYRSIATLVWGLTINTLCATCFGTAYMSHWFPNLFAEWSYWGLVPMLLNGFEYYLQWRWAVKFQLIADKLGAAAGAKEAPKETKEVSMAQMFTNKYNYLRVIIGAWTVSYAGVYGLFAKEALVQYKFLV